MGLGFWAQAVLPSGSGINGPLLDAMLTSPPPHAIPQPSAAEDLKGLAAERTPTADGFALAEPAGGTPLELEIRVAVVPGAEQLELSSDGPWWLRSVDGTVLRQGAAGSTMTLTTTEARASELWLETNAGHAVRVNGGAYAGRLRILRESGRLLAVNHLPLEAYVASVVGAEMPSSWGMEALKAQAVAARSYALAHMARPASRHWHLGSTTRWQAYRGLASSTNRTREAAAATTGLILSYQGGIVESLYAATSEISMEAHGHLGASMSQHGAQALANSGQRYNQILAHYYRGAALARLRQGSG
ncbi:SpoIID/LytB domain-containing protein [Vulcanococcus sp.]|uniref:SpoIID/LytB domain-containing protein n=1 Tax=Vulcanococcus sp. TaxID=2856995 RepID=UPI003F696522